MVQIPTFESDVSIGPEAAPQASVGAAMAPGEALAHLGSAMSDQMQAFEQKYADAARQSDAANIMAATTQKLGDAQFKWSRVPDRLQAMAGFKSDAQDILGQATNGIIDPELRSYLTEQIGREATIRSIDTGNAAFGLESSTRRAQLLGNLNNYAIQLAQAQDPELQAHIAGQAAAAIHGAVAGHWLLPEEGEQQEINFKSQVQEVRARELIGHALNSEDPKDSQAAIDALSDPSQFPGLIESRRAQLLQLADSADFRIQSRAAYRQEHADAVAAREYSRNQASNEAQMLAGVNKGQTYTPDQIQHLADTGQLSPGGVGAIITAQDRQSEGRDDPTTALQLWNDVGQGKATRADVFAAFTDHKLKLTTATSMLHALDTDQSAAVKRAFGQLRTALSAKAIENGTATFVGKDQLGAAQLVTQAQSEFYHRVYGLHEDPQAVSDDIIRRYAPTLEHPVGLPIPKFGAPVSMQDLSRIGVETLKAHQGGSLSDADYQNQVQILNQYRAFFLEQQKRQAAMPKGPTKAKVVGETPEP